MWFALLKAIVPWIIKAGLAYFALRTGYKVGQKVSDEVAEDISQAIFGPEGEV